VRFCIREFTNFFFIILNENSSLLGEIECGTYGFKKKYLTFIVWLRYTDRRYRYHNLLIHTIHYLIATLFVIAIHLEIVKQLTSRIGQTTSHKDLLDVYSVQKHESHVLNLTSYIKKMKTLIRKKCITML